MKKYKLFKNQAVFLVRHVEYATSKLRETILERCPAKHVLRFFGERFEATLNTNADLRRTATLHQVNIFFFFSILA